MRISIAAWSEQGPREANEDRALFSDAFVVVSDGMGGHAYGAECAQAACEAAFGSLKRGRSVREAVEDADSAVLALKEEHPFSDRFAGATILVARFAECGRLELGWVGDSLAFKLRQDACALERLTEPGRVVPFMGILDSALGLDGFPMIVREKTVEDVADGDTLLFATDGVWESIGESRVIEILRDASDLKLAAMRLSLIGAESSGDNATAVVVKYVNG